MTRRPLLSGVDPLSGADRQRRYRERKRAQGGAAARGKRKSLFQSGEFVAIDGEGFSDGPLLECVTDTSGIRYAGREHFYALLSASDGTEVYAPSGRLSMQECLDFLIDVRQRAPKAILVAFAASYDVTQMLAYDLPRDQLATLMAPEELGKRRFAEVTVGSYIYRIEYRARKALTVWRWKRGDRRWRDDGKSGRKIINCNSVTLWDVWGFFQDSFKGTLAKWLPGHPDYEFISRMKDDRARFARDQIDEIRSYTRAELRCLVALMDRVRIAVDGLGLSLARWDGAGAIAAAMMKHHEVRTMKQDSPAPVFEAARGAYSGGHIEVCKIGRHHGTVHHYDVNSAYPHQFRLLPSIKDGSWQQGFSQNPPPGFTLVRVEYRFNDGLPFYPLFFREANGRIIYPPRGTGWYWFAEFDAAREFAARFGAAHFRVLEWWHMTPADLDARPFAWIEAYYERRKFLVEQAKRSGVPSGEEKILKLGYNACYGKTAQQVGARLADDGGVQPPAYFQLEWSGFVTAGCRAQLMRAAMTAPHAIIAFATDGLFATEPLPLDAPKEKLLGAWEYAQHAGMTMVMPGVYWLHEDDGRDTLHSRGFDKSQMRGAETVIAAWRARRARLTVKLTRLIGLGSALTSDAFWQLRGRFVETTKELALNGDNSKRYPAMLYRLRPDLGLVATDPRDHFDDILAPLSELQSALYEIDWLSRPARDDALADADIEAARAA